MHQVFIIYFVILWFLFRLFSYIASTVNQDQLAMFAGCYTQFNEAEQCESVLFHLILRENELWVVCFMTVKMCWIALVHINYMDKLFIFWSKPSGRHLGMWAFISCIPGCHGIDLSWSDINLGKCVLALYSNLTTQRFFQHNWSDLTFVKISCGARTSAKPADVTGHLRDCREDPFPNCDQFFQR